MLGNNAPAPMGRILAQSAVPASAQSAANVACIQSDESICVAKLMTIEMSERAASSYRLQAGGEQFFHVTPGTSLKVAVRT